MGMALPAMSASLSPAKREGMNNDIMVLISKPMGKNTAKLDPLRLQKSIASSSGDSQETFESRDRRSFIYPPDLKTAQEMIK